MNSSTKYLLLIVICCITILSCKKGSSPDNAVPETIQYNFKFWNTVAGVPTNFSSNNSAYPEHWDFGDGGTLSLAHGSDLSTNTTYTYRMPGIYTVTLIINN